MANRNPGRHVPAAAPAAERDLAGVAPRQNGAVPMRTECKNYESRTYASGDTVRKCNLDLAPEAPWRCPDDCPKYERRLADVAWQHGTAIAPPTPEAPASLGEDDSIAALLDEAEEIINAAVPSTIAEVQAEQRRRRGWRRIVPRKRR